MSSQADNVTMTGEYWLAVKGTMDVIAAAAPMVLDAVAAMDLEHDDSAFCFSDMGCADGGSSMSLVRSVIGAVRERCPSRQINILYTDQPRNNYNALFRLVHDAAGSSLKSYKDEFDRLYVHAAGTSFYEQMMPDQTLDLGFSSTAMHWLRGKPVDIPDHVHAVGASGDALTRIQTQASRDWELNLLNRAREMKPGARLVLANFCRDEQGRYLGNTGGVNMFDTFNELWLEKLERNEIRADEYECMTLPQYYNDVDEFSAPFSDSNSAVRSAGLVLEHMETKVVECPYRADFERHGDVEQFVESYVPTVRTWSESTFFGALSEERSAEERQTLVDEFYAAYGDRVRSDPSAHRMDYVHAYVKVAKN